MQPDSALIYEPSGGFTAPQGHLKALLEKHAVWRDGGVDPQFEALVKVVLTDSEGDPHRLWPSPHNGLFLAVLPLKPGTWTIHFMENTQPTEAQSKLSRLTLRELDVVFWVAQGKDNASIGGILDIRPATVRKHMQNIMQKLECENRTAVAALYNQVFSHH
jgi:DNA-binding CsgD family transcriptional regulator